MYTVTIEALDGPAIRTTTHAGQTYVGGTLGQRYQIKVHQGAGRGGQSSRFLAVCTVDGRNVLDAKPGSIDGQGLVITYSGAFDGWRTSMEYVAAFRITSPAESYASGKGDVSNVGVIGVAIFEEKRAVRPPPVRRLCSTPAVMRGATRGIASPRPASAGTGFGESHTSRVTTTTFDRQAKAAETIEIRYDTIEALIEAGILQPPGPSAFPADAKPVDFCTPPE